MPEPQHTSQINRNLAPEYIIYTFEPSDVLPHRLHWKKQSVTNNKLSAYQAGQKLFSLKKYDRIELYERAYANDRHPETVKPIHRWQIKKCAFSMYNLFWISGVLILFASFIVFHSH